VHIAREKLEMVRENYYPSNDPTEEGESNPMFMPRRVSGDGRAARD